MNEVSDEPTFSLATMPPTPGHRRLAFTIAIIVLLSCGAIAPFATTALPRSDAFIPTLEGMFLVNELITSILLFIKFSVTRLRVLLVLACGYLFTALIIIPHMLTFPGAFSSTGLLGAGLQSTAWIYLFWHIGFSLAVLIYAWPKDGARAEYTTRVSVQSTIRWSAAIVIFLVCGLTWVATAAGDYLPRFFLDRTRLSPLSYYAMTLNFSICALAFVLLWIRRRSVLDQWLMVVCCALLSELVLSGLLNTARFSLGWYAGRVFSFFTSMVVLVVLLEETTRLYATLARSNMALRRERQNKLMSLEALAASLSHEVRQPLTAIVTRGSAGLRFLGHVPPNLEEVRSAFNAMVSDGHRVGNVIDGMRGLFTGAVQREEAIDVNGIALEALRILRQELEEHRVITHVELTPDLPLITGHSGQLQEVLLNLIHNAVEAMDAIRDRSRVLRVITQRDRDAITVAVGDTGPGIHAEQLDSIFDAFATTKPKGTGLGLAICRTIVERHGGQLSVWSDEKRPGALFQFTLAINSSAGSPAAPL